MTSNVVSEHRWWRMQCYLIWKFLRIKNRFSVLNSLLFRICLFYLFKWLNFRLIASGQRPNINAEQVVWQLVRLFASLDDPTLKTKVLRLSKALADYQPDFLRQLTQRRKSLDQAIQGGYLTDSFLQCNCKSSPCSPLKVKIN